MSWFLAVIIGHLLNAVSYILDKVLLTKSIQNAYAFTFYIGLLGLLALVLAPLGLEIPNGKGLLLDAGAGVTFTVALLFFFLALQGSEASRVVPLIGGGIPLLTLLYAYVFLGERLSAMTLFAILLLIVGTIMLVIDDTPEAQRNKDHRAPLGPRAWLWGLIAATAFALSFGLTKQAFEDQPFFSAFIWTRIGAFLFPVLFLLHRSHRRAIVDTASTLRTRAGALYLVAQGFGAAGFVFINYAIAQTSVSVVNALQGVQYAFLLFAALVGSLKYPHLLQESMTRRGLILKSIAVVVVGIGLFFIARTTPS